MSDVERTLPASPRRRAWAREQGYSPRSAALTGALVLMAAAALAAVQGAQLLNGIGVHLRVQLSTVPQLSLNPLQAVDRLRENALSIGLLAGWWLAAAWGAALAFNLLQTGFQWSPVAIHPDLSRIDPSIGTRRLFSPENLATVLWGLLVTAAMAFAAMFLTGTRFQSLEYGRAVPTGGIATHAIESVGGVILQLSGMLTLLTTIDVVWRRWRFEQSLRMSPEELRDETDRRKTHQRRGGLNRW